MKECERDTFFSTKDIRKGYLSCPSGIQKVKRLDARAEPPLIKLCRAPLPSCLVSRQVGRKQVLHYHIHLDFIHYRYKCL